MIVSDSLAGKIDTLTRKGNHTPLKIFFTFLVGDLGDSISEETAENDSTNTNTNSPKDPTTVVNDKHDEEHDAENQTNGNFSVYLKFCKKQRNLLPTLVY